MQQRLQVMPSSMSPVSDAFKVAYADVGVWQRPDQLPIVYHPCYNIGFWGLERVHPFDSQKFRRIVNVLQSQGLVQPKQLVRPVEASNEVLRDLHTQEYLDQLHSSSRKVAAVAELAPLALLPNWLVQNRVCKPFRHHVSGTMLAAALALEHGWAINLGGGMHHARFDNGEGWCAYSDLTLALRRLRHASGGKIRKCMVIDLDVHQGNGHERDKLHFEDPDMYIVDIYGRDLWPGDTVAKQAIDIDIGIPCGTSDDEYLDKTRAALQRAFQEFTPDIVLYNAGTDILVGDPLGRMEVSAEGVCQRDQLVWQAAAEEAVPIVMVMSGGYARNNFQVVGDSVANLLRTFQLTGKDGTAQVLRPLPQSGGA